MAIVSELIIDLLFLVINGQVRSYSGVSGGDIPRENVVFHKQGVLGHEGYFVAILITCRQIKNCTPILLANSS